MAAGAARLGYEAYQVWGPHSQAAKMTPAKKSAALMQGSLQSYPALTLRQCDWLHALISSFLFRRSVGY